MSSRQSLSIVEYFAEHSGYRCGYCKQEDTNFSHGMWGHTLTTQDYQDLIDRGWRRSGQYCYKPTMARTCCPLYTIKCDTVRFKPTKSQKKVMKRFVNYILHNKKSGGETSAKEEDMEKDEEVLVERDVEVKGMQVEKELGLQNLEGLEKLRGPKTDQVLESTLNENCNGDIDVDSSRESTPAPSKQCSQGGQPPKGMDPDKPKQGKAKIARREKWEKKVKEGKVDPKKMQNPEKTVEEFLNFNSSNSIHTFTKRLVKADDSDPTFVNTFHESLLVYQKYQMAVHGDTEDKCNEKQFKRFLCSSPLQSESGEGSFHLQYLIDSKIIAVGVIDILPRCVSSVYLYYDPEYHFLSPGTLTSLLEICFVRELAKTNHPNITNYYLGFYIHNCVKMRYKGRYSPSFLCCPETYTWHPLDSCVPLLDKSPYSRLEREASIQDREKPVDIQGVGVLYCRQATTYQIYRDILEEEGESRDADKDEVLEYSILVGDRLAKRMLLYRPS